jgi:hypothetical protein
MRADVCVGQVTFRVKKPLKGITVSITFCGVTDVEGKLVNFISEFRDLYSGGGFLGMMELWRKY